MQTSTSFYRILLSIVIGVPSLILLTILSGGAILIPLTGIFILAPLLMFNLLTLLICRLTPTCFCWPKDTQTLKSKG